jgi:hypothetical protein
MTTISRRRESCLLALVEPRDYRDIYPATRDVVHALARRQRAAAAAAPSVA